MAYGTELILGFRGKNIYEIAKNLGLKINLDFESDDYEDDITPEQTLGDINKKLEKVWLNCLRNDLSLEVVRAKIQYQNGHTSREGWYILKSDKARAAAKENAEGIDWTSEKQEDHLQEAQPFYLGVYFDPDEVGDEEEDAVFGISLVTRYSPCFLDLDQPHGGSSGVIKLDKNNLAKIETARKAIVTILPQWEDADIIIKELHY